MDIEANRVGKDFISIAKYWLNNGIIDEAGEHTFKYEGFQFPIKSEIQLHVVDYAVTQNYLVNAFYMNIYGSRYINFKIGVTLDFGQQDFNRFYMDVVNVVRHELEHYFDDIEGRRKGDQGYNPEDVLNYNLSIEDKFESTAKYLQSYSEQIPFIKGFVLQCKKTGVNFFDKIRLYVHEELFSDDKYNEDLIKSTIGYRKAEEIENRIVDMYMKKYNEIYGAGI